MSAWSAHAAEGTTDPPPNGPAGQNQVPARSTLSSSTALTWMFVERVTRIELALSAWEAQRLRLPGALTRRPRRPE
jgi:hypothetical protein